MILFGEHSLNVQSSLSINSDDSRGAESCLLVNVLVSVDEQARSSSVNVARECLKAKVNVVVPVMDVSWRVVGDEDIDGGKGRQRTLDF